MNIKKTCRVHYRYSSSFENRTRFYKNQVFFHVLKEYQLVRFRVLLCSGRPSFCIRKRTKVVFIQNLISVDDEGLGGSGTKNISLHSHHLSEIHTCSAKGSINTYLQIMLTLRTSISALPLAGNVRNCGNIDVKAQMLITGNQSKCEVIDSCYATPLVRH